MPSSRLRKGLIIPVTVFAIGFWLLVKSLEYFKKIKFRLKSNRDIQIVESVNEWERVYPKLKEKCKQIKAVGFDCEWVYQEKRRPVSLLQIATHDGFCVLVRIHKMSSPMPATLQQFLSDRSIRKLGVSAADDGKKLFADYGLIVNGCVDLRYLLKRVREYRCVNQSLQGIAKGVLDVAMTKDLDIRCGNWESEQLSRSQVDYAAEDALVAVDIFMQLVLVKIFGINKRKVYYGSWADLDEAEIWKTAQSLCQGLVDVPYKSRQNNSIQDKDSAMLPGNAQGPGKEPYPSPAKGKASKAYMTRQTPLYYNCRLLAPDGALLTTCDIRKANWYISKNLGVKVCEDPVTVKLNFEPTARPTSEHDYYLQDRENICVVCGSMENYIRKLIVPQEYKRYFPTILKDHSSHDVLLMCLSCHSTSNNCDAVLRQRLALECDAPLDSGKGSKTLQDHDLQMVVSAAKALLRSRQQIPAERIQELEVVIHNFYGVTRINDELLHRAIKIDSKINNSDFVPHGKRVVNHFISHPGGLLGFEKIWRQHFIDNMKPQHLPLLWSVDHLPERMDLHKNSLYSSAHKFTTIR